MIESNNPQANTKQKEKWPTVFNTATDSLAWLSYQLKRQLFRPVINNGFSHVFLVNKDIALPATGVDARLQRQDHPRCQLDMLIGDQRGPFGQLQA